MSEEYRNYAKTANEHFTLLNVTSSWSSWHNNTSFSLSVYVLVVC